jgi:phytoene dehydrogenase-like protein
MSEEDKSAFKALLQKVVSMTDVEIEPWDNSSFKEWLLEHVPQPSIRELFSDLGMIMTTIPDAGDMAAGEALYIARENLQKTGQVLQASYPLEGTEGLIRGLAQIIKEHGGEIMTNCQVQEVVIQDNKAVGVRVPCRKHIYQKEYAMLETVTIYGDRIVYAVPIYRLNQIIDFNPVTSPMPRWWVKRIIDIQHEITGLIGYMIGLSEPIVDPNKRCFFSALTTKHTGLPFQGFPASNFSPRVAPDGKQLIYTDIVCEHSDASDKFKREKLLDLMWGDIQEMFPSIEDKVEWKLSYYVDGCDGLARKPGLVGKFKPGLSAPGVANLFFAGDTYLGRGLATNSAARSAMLCADLIMSTFS